jgi:hypothetical protein
MAKQTFTTGQVLSAAQMTSLQQTAMGGGSTTAKTASYTLVAADAGTVVQMNSASATTITVNTALFAAGDTVQIQNVGTGVCTVTAGTATVNTSATLALKQYDGGQLYFNTTSAAIFFSSDAADGASPLTTKGDLYTFTTVDARLGVGANDLVLTADSAQATGLKYSGAWTTWTPSYTNLTLGNGTVVARYCQIGKVVFFNFFLTFGSTTSMTAANPTFSLPVAATRSTLFYNGNILDSGTVNYSAFGETTTGLTAVTWRVQKLSGIYQTTGGCEPTVPMTWTTSDNYQLSGSYEVA